VKKELFSSQQKKQTKFSNEFEESFKIYSINSFSTRSTMAKNGRKYDLVLYGASGFTGQLTARYLAQHAPKVTFIIRLF
jgi:hypothetical protein